MWSFTWWRDWSAVWAPSHIASWREAVGSAGVHATPFMHPDVVRGWCVSADAERAFDPFFMHARHVGGQQVMLLMVRPRGQLRHGYVQRLHPVGLSLFDYQDPVIAPAGPDGTLLAPGFWPAFRRELERHGGSWFDTCSFHRLRTEVLGSAEYKASSKTAPYLRLTPYADFDAYIGARPNRRAEVRRNMRRAGLRFRVHPAGEIDQVLDWLPALEAARNDRFPESALPEGYLRALVTEGLGSGVVHCSSLAFEGQPVSWHVGFYLNGTLYGYTPGFDKAAHRGRSPGLTHMCWLVHWLFAEGGHTYDLLLGAEDYKFYVTDGDEFTLGGQEFRSAALASRLRFAAARGIGRITRLAARVRRSGPAPETGADT